VHTRWATPLPHVVRLSADDAPWSIQISRRRAFPTGRSTLSTTGAGDVRGIVLEGNTVRGAVLGDLEVSRTGDSTLIRIAGTKAYRDTVPLEATCRLGSL
jgi:hypothetical protein